MGELWLLHGCAGTSVPAVLAAEREVPVVMVDGHFHVLLPLGAPSEAQGLFHEALAGLFIVELKEFLRPGDQSCQVCFANNFLPDWDLPI